MKKTLLALGLFLLSTATLAGQGLLSIRSNHDVDTTVDRLEAVIKAKGFGVFGKVPHHKGAAKVGMKLRPTTLLIFGNPKVGTILMKQERSIGIDLPLKYLVWEDSNGHTHITWQDPAVLTARHGIKNPPIVRKMQGALRAFATKAAGN